MPAFARSLMYNQDVPWMHTLMCLSALSISLHQVEVDGAPLLSQTLFLQHFLVLYFNEPVAVSYCLPPLEPQAPACAQGLILLKRQMILPPTIASFSHKWPLGAKMCFTHLSQH